MGEFFSRVKNLLQNSKYAAVIAEVVLMTLFNLSTFSVLVRLTDLKTVGLWVLLNSLLSFSKVADFWSAGLVTFVAEDIQLRQFEKAARLVSTALLTAMVGYFVVVLAVGPLLYLYASSIPGVEDYELARSLLPLVCLTFWLSAIATTYHAGFLAFDRPIYKLAQNVGGASLFFVLSLALVPHYEIWGILMAQAIQAVASFAIGIFAFHFRIAPGNAILTWDRLDFKKLTAYGSKASAVGFLQTATDPLIRLLMSKYGGLSAVTLMEVATRVILAVRGIIMSVGQLLVPSFAKATIQNKNEVMKLYDETNKVFFVVTVPAVSCVLAVGPSLEQIMLGQRTALFLPMLWLLGVGWAINMITAPAFFLLAGQRRLRPLFWNRLLMLVVVFVLGNVGGMLFGVLGVTIGVATGLIAASVVTLRAVAEFKTSENSQIGLNLGLRSTAPFLVAIVTTGLCLSSQSFHVDQVGIVLISLCGGILSLIVSLIVLPLDFLVVKIGGLFRG